jgi:hypothetical protein
MQTFLSPSHADKWVKCAAYPALAQKHANDWIVSDHAGEGVAAHWVAGKNNPAHYLAQIAPNGVIIDKNMINCAIEYQNIIKNWKIYAIFEKLIKIPMVYPDFEGSPDCFAIDKETKTVRIIDYKYGHLQVDVVKNWQIICYLSGIKSNYPEIDKNWKIIAQIYQPNAYHPAGELQTWMTDFNYLEPLIKTLADAAKQTYQLTSVATVGEHCRHCCARHACSALQQSSCVAVDISQTICSIELTTPQASKELLQLEAAMGILKARATGLEAQLKHNITKGDISSDYIVERVKSRERWKEDGDQHIINFGKLIGIDLSAPAKALTPSQCRKLLIDTNVICTYSYIPVGESKLVKRNLKSVAGLFGEDDAKC